ncbi:MAG: metallophosphoesterase family protein [Actinomycetota bacterium]
MTVAVLSDVHGVLPALDAVLAEPAVRDADLIVVTGDLAAGPQPVAVLDRLIGLGPRGVLIRGNADRELVSLARGGPDVGDPIAPWAAAQLSPTHLALLDKLPHPVVLPVVGFGRVLFCHGTPRDDEEIVLVDTRLDQWAAVLADVADDVTTVVCGHTHMPFVRLAHGRLIVNPGSVGMPYGRAGAHWALLAAGAVTLCRTMYDIDAACASIRAASTYPAVDEWTSYYLEARGSDADAIAAFGPRDGR